MGDDMTGGRHVHERATKGHIVNNLCSSQVFTFACRSLIQLSSGAVARARLGNGERPAYLFVGNA